MVFKRIIAFSIDYFLIVLWGVILFIISIFLSSHLATWEVIFKKHVTAHLGSFLLMTLPVFIYFSIMESSKWKGTIGKNFVGLKVVVNNNYEEQITFKSALLRNLLRFLPWEIAHTLIHHGDLMKNNITTHFLTVAGLISVCALVIVYFFEILVRSDKRSFYDRVSNTIVAFK